MKTFMARKPIASMQAAPNRMRGLSLIELMVAMVLGLLVLAGTMGLFFSNREASATTDSVGRVQENARIAFETMARDLREAGSGTCTSCGGMTTVLAAPAWWNDLGRGITGYDNGSFAGSAANTDAVEIVRANVSPARIDAASGPADDITLSASNHGLVAGNVALACDFACNTVFQVTGVSDKTIQHAAGGAGGGNSGANFACGRLEAGGAVGSLQGVRWFVADNGRGTNSLYRSSISAGGAAASRDEMIDGVTGLQMQYLLRDADSYVDASAGLDWPNVTAVRITLNLQGEEVSKRNPNQRVNRTLSHVVALRSRLEACPRT